MARGQRALMQVGLMAVLAPISGFVSCADNGVDTRPDAGVAIGRDSGMDSASPIDAGSPDSGSTPDAGTRMDSAMPRDSGGPIDDAGPSDAGGTVSGPDAGACLGDCSGTPLSRRAGECFSAAEGTDFNYVRDIAIMNGTTCPGRGMIVGFVMYMDGICLRTSVYFCK